ncbi:hypothetical protein KAI92_04890 [Candidatus Parcubacteria bacterium]|nr:hypothetical protein [Candidatus Parcubacteria bacterium]
MRYLDFLEEFKDFNAIFYQNIKNIFGKVNASQLSEWRKQKKIISVKKGIIILPNSKIDILLLSNELNYSYISLEYALSYYQIIPDIAQVITSVSKDRNEKITNEVGNFQYRKINSDLFMGFVLIPSNIKNNRYIRIAEPEKALFDLVYFRSDLKDEKDFSSLRLNLEKIKVKKVEVYLPFVNAPQIKKRLNNFIKYLHASI